VVNVFHILGKKFGRREIELPLFKKRIKWKLFTTFSKYFTTFSPVLLICEKVFAAERRKILLISRSYFKNNRSSLFGT
jgi:hypothetical protein